MKSSTTASSKRRLLSVATLLLLLTTRCAWGETISEAQWLQLKELRGIFSGNTSGTPTAYIFFDPNCPYSAKLNTNGFGLPGVNSQRVMWIPVAYLRPTSASKAAALLRSGTYEAIIQNYRNFNYAKYTGSIEGVTPTAEETRAIDASIAAWTAMSSSPGTPMIVYRDKLGALKVQLGLPSEQAHDTERTMGAYEQ